jgi:hypothetical protein
LQRSFQQYRNVFLCVLSFLVHPCINYTLFCFGVCFCKITYSAANFLFCTFLFLLVVKYWVCIEAIFVI